MELAPSPLGAYRFADPTNPPEAVGNIQDNDYKIIEASISFNSQGIARDDGSGNYAGPHWLDKNGDGDAEDEGESRNPTSHVRSTPTSESKVIATLDFNTEGVLTGDFLIIGTGSAVGGLFFFQGPAVIEGTHLRATITSMQALPNTIDNSGVNIIWTIKRTLAAQTEVKTYGASNNQLYVTGASAPNAFHTVLDVGSRNAAGLRPAEAGELDPGASGANQQVVDAIWGDFSDNSVQTADGTVMSYNHDADSGFDTAALLKNKKGRCGAWADFLVAVLGTQGISAVRTGITPRLAAQPDLAGYTKAGAAGFVIKAGNAGQNNAAPQIRFVDHAVVKITSQITTLNAIYDPSYGGTPYSGATRAAAELNWENASVDKMGWIYIDNTTGIAEIKELANDLVVSETKFDQ